MTTVTFNEQALHHLLESTEGPVAKALTGAAIRVDRTAKRLCPVDTGRLRASIDWRVARDNLGLLAIIGTNVTYAPYVEFGTRFARAQPFLRPALQAVKGSGA